METILERFSLEDVQRSPAFFDVKKLNHMNGVYIRELPAEGFIERCGRGSIRCPGRGRPGPGAIRTRARRPPQPPTWEPGRFDAATFARLAPAVQERVTVLGEVPELVDFLFLDGAPDDPESWQKAMAGDEESGRILAEALAAYETCAWDVDALHAATLAIAEGVGRKLGKAQAPDPGGCHGEDARAAPLRLAGGAGPGRARRRLAVALDRLAADH